MNYFIGILFIFIVVNLSACEKISVYMTPSKKAIPSTSPLAKQAEKSFWQTLHQGNYKNIPHTQKLLTAAYIENPNDPMLAEHLGFIHIWKITEHAREKNHDPNTVNEIILARKFFADANDLMPNHPIILGFLGDSLLVEGKIFHDEREQVRGYFILKDAIKRWPEFNYFTAGYPMSMLPADSSQFKEALHWQWKTLSLCANNNINKQNPDFSPYLSLETKTGPKRACWNSWIAPHNFEGFFLNMGDMLVKQGDWQTGVKIYNNAKLSRTYSTWPYKKMLEERITSAEQNVRNFQQQENNDPNKTILFKSGFGCVVCHQNN